MASRPSPPADLRPLEQEVLEAITPTPDEQAALRQDAADLTAAAQAVLERLGIPGRAAVQGSVAKGTWLAGGGDIDLFLLLDPKVPIGTLEGLAARVAESVLKSPRRRYAQHPYVVGSFRDRSVDLVPAYAVPSPALRMSAVDRTPFHTEWVLERVDARMAAEVRLAKRWLKGIGAYGAQTANAGLSGYLVEVLVVWAKSFHGLLGYLAGGAKPRRLALGEDHIPEDPPAALRVADPVDPARNCAAAVSEETLALAGDAAKAYLAKPDPRFFFPAPERAEADGLLVAHLAARGEAWVAALLRPQDVRLDIVYPQFQRAARSISEQMDAAGFPTVRMATRWEEPDGAGEGDAVLMQWVVGTVQLPPTRIHRGPRADAQPNVRSFRQKWENHPDAQGPVQAGADGRMEVEVRNRWRTAHAWLSHHLPQVSVGAHVLEAVPTSLVPAQPSDLPFPLDAAATDLILDRRPWER